MPTPTEPAKVGSMEGAATDLTAWAAAAGCAWMMVRLGVTKGMLKAKAPARCAACGRQKVGGRCRCTDDR